MVPADLGQLRQDMAGADGIAADAVLGQLNGHGAGQRDHAALGCTIDGAAAQHDGVIQGPDVDDAAGLALVHLPAHRLADEIHALQVGVHDAVVSLLRHVQQTFPLVDACDVEQHINFSVPLHHFVHTGLDGGHIRHVQEVGRGLAALFRDLIRQRLALGQRPAAQGHFRPRVGQSLADGRADAAGGTGDEDGLALQAEYGIKICTVIHE